MKFDNFSIQEPDANVKVKDTFEIDSDLKELAEDVILNRTENATELLVEKASDYLSQESASSRNDQEWREGSVEERISHALINGINKSATLSGLGKGTYNICFKVDGQPNYEQCFEATIAEPKSL